MQAIAGAFDVELSALQITRRIAESELARVRLARTAKEFISAENADTCHAFTKNIIVSLQPEIEDRVNDLMRAVFCDREYIDRDEPGMWDSYLDSIKEPLQELVDLGFAFFMLDERRDILLKPLNGIAPKEDHIPNWGIRHYLLVARHGCFQLDRSSPLHQFNESCPSCGETLLRYSGNRAPERWFTRMRYLQSVRSETRTKCAGATHVFHRFYQVRASDSITWRWCRDASRRTATPVRSNR